MIQLLDSRYASSRTVSRKAVQTRLYRMTYQDQNMATYIDQFTSLFSQLERMGQYASIPETHTASMLLASIDLSCCLELRAPALSTKKRIELTSEFVQTKLIDECNAKRLLLGTAQSAHIRRKNRIFWAETVPDVKKER